jgi:molybdenum cofactor biosynthesis enzyme MoaA
VLRNKETILAETAKRAPVVSGLPYYYTIHLNRPCNQQCIMCLPVGKFPADVLPFERFVELFDSMKDVAEHVTLIGGEPLMYPRIADALDLLAEHPVAVTMNTNATLLTPKITPHLLGVHELHLKCSIDAATRSTYHRIRGRDQFERVTANLREFSTVSAHLRHVHHILVYVVMRENLDEVLPFLDFAASLSLDRVEYHPVRHVTSWQVENGTGWRFDGREQSCEFFTDEYNDVMRQAADRASALGLECETLLL